MDLANGFSSAWNEVTLVVFTALAPAGVVAFIAMALPSIVGAARLETARRQRLERMLCIPVVVAMVGLVASATHLGNPANALYVISGFGRSPLSNEVVFGVAFLGSAGLYWLTSFSVDGGRPRLRRAALVAISALGVVFVDAIAFAYDAPTILSWHMPLVPISLWLNSVMGGSILALVGFRAANYRSEGGRMEHGLVVVAAVGLVANLAVYGLWAVQLPAMENALTSAALLAPHYGLMVAAFGVFAAGGIALAAQLAWRDENSSLFLLCVSYGLVTAALLIMRFAFYMTHMTVGL